MDKDEKILKLIKKIDSGGISCNEASRQLDAIEREHGTSDILYDIENRNDTAYYDELILNARLGIYNRQSLLKMAEMKFEGSPNRNKTNNAALIVGGIILLIVIAVIIIAIAGGA